MSQSGTDAPTATVLENTLGGTVVWSYTASGVYTATLTGAFTADKTFTYLEDLQWDGLIGSRLSRTGTGTCVLTISAGDDYLAGSELAQIEIRVYP